MNDEQQRTEMMVDEALQTYPQVALPPGFVSQIMTQIEALPRAEPERFRLHFLDIALTFLIGGTVTLLLLGIFTYLGIVNWGWLSADVQVSFNSINSLSASARFWLILGLILFVEMVIGAGVCVQLWQDRPYSVA